MADDTGADKEEEMSLAPPPEEEKKDDGGGAPGWMATFADLVTLLMCFFVLLFAMSTTQQETYKELVKSLRSALGAQAVPESGTREGLTMHAVPSEEPSENQQIDELGGMIEKELEEKFGVTAAAAVAAAPAISRSSRQSAQASRCEAIVCCSRALNRSRERSQRANTGAGTCRLPSAVGWAASS